MTKREFLARVYRIILEKELSSFDVAVAQLMKEIK